MFPGGQQPGMGMQPSLMVPSVDDFVDLDNFLDSYLTQLQTDHHAAQQQHPHGGGTQGTQVVTPAPGMTAGAMGSMATQMLLPSSAPVGGPQGQGPPPGMMPPMPGLGQGNLPGLQGHHSGGPVQPFPGAGGPIPDLSALMGSIPGMGGLPGFGMQSQPMFGSGGPRGGGPDFLGAAGLAPGMGMSGPMGGAPSLAGMPDLLGLQASLGQGLGGLPLGAPAGAPALHSMPPPAAPTTNTTSKRGGGRGAAGGASARASKSGARPRSEPVSSSEHGDSSDDNSSDVPETKQRKKQLTSEEAERRHLALQEKNRRAQRRFRERQKTKLQDLHKQIEELTSRVSNLQHENSALHSRTSILEKVLDMRNEQIQVMQETKETTVYPAEEEELLQLQEVGGQLVQLNPDMIKELSSDQIYKIYQMYVKELNNRLSAEAAPAGGDTASALGAAGSSGETGTPPPDGASTSTAIVPHSPELEKLVKDLSMLIMRLGVVKPLETRKFIVVSRQYLGSSEADVIELWKNVMKAIQLTEPQKREVVELKRMFLHKIEPIMEERKHLNVQIQANLPHDTFHTKNALTYIKAHEAVIKLRDNLRAEQHVVLEFAIAVFRGVFRPRQMALLLVKCFPAVPDALGIASALAAELGEPDTTSARNLTMQMGGYLGEAAANTALGTNFMTLHPTLVNPAAVTAAGGTTGAAGGLPPAGASGVGPAAGGTDSRAFDHWTARPDGVPPGVPQVPSSTLYAIADQGAAALAASQQQQASG